MGCVKFTVFIPQIVFHSQEEADEIWGRMIELGRQGPIRTKKQSGFGPFRDYVGGVMESVLIASPSGEICSGCVPLTCPMGPPG